MNFIYRKEQALTPLQCARFIEAFEKDVDHQQEGVISKDGLKSTVDKKFKSSTDISINPTFMQSPIWKPLLKELLPILLDGLDDYKTQYYVGVGLLDPMWVSTFFNIQRYKPGEGYNVYHCERASLLHPERQLVWMIYLNDVIDKGWTEFFYQQHFETPKVGKMVIWPSDFTHTHRGVASDSEVKYILTGWFEYQTDEQLKQINERENEEG